MTSQPSSGRTQTLRDLFDRAKGRIERHEPADARTAMADGAFLVDIRTYTDRQRDGIVPGSLHIPRTVLEWRLDPDSDFRNPHVGGLDDRIILICDHGFSSVLAAATLVDIGFEKAGDVVGGFEAWRAAGLPVTEAPEVARAPGAPAGMNPPDR